jgi:hypothetical protein
MTKLFDRIAGWATPIATLTDYPALAYVLGHRDRKHDCLSRRQGLCPGLEYCHDCPWVEGTSREDPRR